MAFEYACLTACLPSSPVAEKAVGHRLNLLVGEAKHFMQQGLGFHLGQDAVIQGSGCS